MLARMAAPRRHCCSAVGNFAHNRLSRHRWVRGALQRATCERAPAVFDFCALSPVDHRCSAERAAASRYDAPRA